MKEICFNLKKFKYLNVLIVKIFQFDVVMNLIFYDNMNINVKISLIL